MDIKESFCSIYNDHIVREGSQALLSWLLESDFFTAPASTKYHGAHEGGLVEHSLHVYNRLRRLCIAACSTTFVKQAFMPSQPGM